MLVREQATDHTDSLWSKPRTHRNPDPRPCRAVTQRQFITIPLGPVIQALYGSPETANKMHYRAQATTEILKYARMHGGKVKKYCDTTCGHDYLEAVKAGKIKNHDVLVQLSLVTDLTYDTYLFPSSLLSSIATYNAYQLSRSC